MSLSPLDVDCEQSLSFSRSQEVKCVWSIFSGTKDNTSWRKKGYQGHKLTELKV